MVLINVTGPALQNGAYLAFVLAPFLLLLLLQIVSFLPDYGSR
jgi:hypothetical protein